MEPVTRPACYPGIRNLILLPVAIDLAADGCDGQRAVSGEDYFVDPAEVWRVLARGARRFLYGQQAAHVAGVRYGSNGNGRCWLMLAAGGSEAQTLGGFLQPGMTYRLTLACADVFGCPDQHLSVEVMGGAVASATFAIPATQSSDGAWSFVLCGLDFVPSSEEAVTIRLTNSVALAAADGIPVQNRLPLVLRKTTPR